MDVPLPVPPADLSKRTRRQPVDRGPRQPAVWHSLRHWFGGETFKWKEYALVTAVVAGITAIGVPLPDEYYQALGFVYLLAVILLSLRVGRGAALWAGFSSVAVWDYVFIPVRWGWGIDKLSDALLLGPYFVVALVLSQVTVWIRDQAREEQVREQRATSLYHLMRVLAAANSLDEAAVNSLRQVDELLGTKTALVLTAENGDLLAPHAASSFPLESPELTAMTVAVRSRHPVGRFTGTLPDSAGYYVPLLRDERVLGVLGVRAPGNATLNERQRDLLDVFVRQFALIVEREHLRAAGEREKLLAQSAKLHRTLLESVSHELRTPLSVITAALESLDDADPVLRDNLLVEARTAAGRLNRVVGNLLDQTRLESGALKPRLNWCDARDLVNAALEGTREALTGRPLAVMVGPDFPLVRADFALTEQALANLLFNAAQHTPSATPVSVTAGLEDGGRRVYFAVDDRGPGFSPDLRERLFHKFVRGGAARPGGLGLGLSLVRGFMAAQGGEVVIGDNPGGGASIRLYLPHIIVDNSSPE